MSMYEPRCEEWAVIKDVGGDINGGEPFVITSAGGHYASRDGGDVWLWSDGSVFDEDFDIDDPPAWCEVIKRGWTTF